MELLTDDDYKHIDDIVIESHGKIDENPKSQLFYADIFKSAIDSGEEFAIDLFHHFNFDLIRENIIDKVHTHSSPYIVCVYIKWSKECFVDLLLFVFDLVLNESFVDLLLLFVFDLVLNEHTQPFTTGCALRACLAPGDTHTSPPLICLAPSALTCETN